jgi:signal peptidase
MEKLKKTLKIIGKIVNVLVSVVLVLAVFLLVFTAFSPIKSFQILRVMSGSMEPKIKVGGVVIVNKVPTESLKVGDVITFTSSDDPTMTVTHRLMEIKEKDGKTVFSTRGDANQSNDIGEVSPDQVKGKVLFSIPFLGYISVWMKQPLGFVLLVILPAIAIIVNEIINIKKSIEKEMETKYQKLLAEKEEETKKIKKRKTQKKEIVALLLFFSLSIIGIKPTFAYFSNTAVVSDNTFSMGCWVAPSIPVLSQTGQTISWQASTPNCPVAQVSYDYEVSKDENFSNIQVSGNTSLTSITLSDLFDGTYYWRVRARNQYDNVSDYSLVGSFTLGSIVSPGDVVINELMWTGIFDSEQEDLTDESDEWIELRNTTDQDIDLSGWYLTNLSGKMFTIPEGKEISANGFFLISRLDAEKSKIKNNPDLVVGDQLILDDKNLQIKLYDSADRLIDTANDGGAPVAGSKGVMLNMSMERNDNPKTGWHTCIDHSDKAKDYWDSGVEDRGTPGGQNLSENDPSEKTLLHQEPQISFSLREDKKAVSFTISGVADYEKLTYDIVYDAKPVERGIFGEIPLAGEDSVSREDLLLGTCSSLKQYCVYDQGMTQVSLKIVLFKGSEEKEIYKEIKYK